MAVEHAPEGKRGFYGAFPQMGAPAGVGLATIAFYFASQLAPRAFLAWGWRLPFLFSAVLVVVGLVIRLTIAESPEFEKVRESSARVNLPVAEAHPPPPEGDPPRRRHLPLPGRLRLHHA